MRYFVTRDCINFKYYYSDSFSFINITPFQPAKKTPKYSRMRAVTKREVCGEGEDGKQNVLLLFRKSITSSYYKESVGSNSY